MSRNGEALRLTEDHKPNLPRERKRVEVRAADAVAVTLPPAVAVGRSLAFLQLWLSVWLLRLQLLLCVL
jgi:hypothetical protein